MNIFGVKLNSRAYTITFVNTEEAFRRNDKMFPNAFGVCVSACAIAYWCVFLRVRLLVRMYDQDGGTKT